MNAAIGVCEAIVPFHHGVYQQGVLARNDEKEGKNEFGDQQVQIRGCGRLSFGKIRVSSTMGARSMTSLAAELLRPAPQCDVAIVASCSSMDTRAQWPAKTKEAL